MNRSLTLQIFYETPEFPTMFELYIGIHMLAPIHIAMRRKRRSKQWHDDEKDDKEVAEEKEEGGEGRENG